MRQIPLTFSIQAYEGAFTAWLQARRDSGQIRRESSADLYQDIWGSFSAWCAGQNPPVALASLNRTHLLAFQGSRTGVKNAALSARHALRVLRLIDQVVQHWSAANVQCPSTAAQEAIELQPIIRYAESGLDTRLPHALDPREARRLIIFLSRARPRLDSCAVSLDWHVLRNRVAVALQLGAGLGPSDIRFLTLGSPITAGGPVKDRPWKLEVPSDGTAPAHETPVARWAAELLKHWLSIRSEQAIEGNWLFPSTRTGKPWGKMAQYNAARQVFNDAGLQLPDGGSLRLRHTFALRQLHRGTDPQLVARWLGVSEPKVMLRYARVLALQAEAV